MSKTEKTPANSNCNTQNSTQPYQVKRRMCDRDRYDLLRARAKEICAQLSPVLGGEEFDDYGNLIQSVSVVYLCDRWQQPDEKTEFILPLEFAELQQIITHDRQEYQSIVEAIETYADDLAPITQLITQRDNDQLKTKLENLAHAAGGSIDFAYDTVDNVVDIVYHRYSRLRYQTISEAKLLTKTYNPKGQSFLFMLPVDYHLLREMLRKDVELYAALPADRKRPMRWEATWARDHWKKNNYVIKSP